MYRVDYSPRAFRDLRSLPRTIQERIRAKVDQLSPNPRVPGYTKLSGQSAYRVRVGDYRIIYEIHDAVLTVLVVRVGHRREVYE